MFDLVAPWLVPTLTYLLPTVIPSLRDEQTSIRWALGASAVETGIFFGVGFPDLFPSTLSRTLRAIGVSTDPKRVGCPRVASSVKSDTVPDPEGRWRVSSEII